MPLLLPLHVLMLLSLLILCEAGAHAGPLTLNPQPATRAVPGPLEKALVLAYEALGRGDLDTADSRFKEAADIDPKSAVPYIGLAEVAMHRNLPSMAEAFLKKAMSTDPGNRAAFRAWGRFLFTQKKYIGAESAFKQALSLGPDDPGILIDLGENYLNGLNRPGKAEDAYRRAIKLNPKLPGAHMGLAAALAVQGQIRQAVKEYNLAAEYQPESPLPMHMLGRLYASQHRFTESLGALDRALRINPKYLPGLLERGDVHAANHEPDKALTDYQTAVNLAPKLALAHFKMGAVYQTQKQWQKAEAAYLRAIDADPNLIDAYNNLAWMSADRKQKLDEGLRWIEKAIQIAPKSANLYDTLGWVRRARGENDLAIAAFERAVAMHTPPQPDTLYHLGLAYVDAGRNSDAVVVLRQALDSSESFPEAGNARRQLRELQAE